MPLNELLGGILVGGADWFGTVKISADSDRSENGNLKSKMCLLAQMTKAITTAAIIGGMKYHRIMVCAVQVPVIEDG